MVIIIGAKTTIVSHKAHKRGWFRGGFHAANTAGQRTQQKTSASLRSLLLCRLCEKPAAKPADSDKTFGTGHFGQPRFIQSVDNKFFVSGICIET